MALSTVRAILEKGVAYLAKRPVDQPRLAMELLLSRLLGCPRLELYLRLDQPLTEPQVEAMRRGLRRVASGEPIQYIVGEAGFMNHTFKVDRRAMVPRPETETLVETVLEWHELWILSDSQTPRRPVVVDVGTGCGCIVLSLLLVRPQGVYIALDISAEALDLARENARHLGVADRVCFVAAELPDAVEPESVDAVVSNPPYVPTEAYEHLPLSVRQYEPRTALDGGPGGLAVIQTVLQDAAVALKPHGFLFLEIGADQGDAVRRMAIEFGFTGIEIRRDLAGRDRIVCARRMPE